jgi:hypothetical protein
MHIVYATITVPTTNDGGTWLVTDIEDKINTDLDPIGRVISTVEAGADIPDTEELGFEFWTHLTSRQVEDRLQSILDAHDPVDTIVGVD